MPKHQLENSDLRFELCKRKYKSILIIFDIEKAPQSFQARKGEIIEAFKYGPACFQSSGGSNTLEQSEDCLSINVFVPGKYSHFFAHFSNKLNMLN